MVRGEKASFFFLFFGGATWALSRRAGSYCHSQADSRRRKTKINYREAWSHYKHATYGVWGAAANACGKQPFPAIGYFILSVSMLQ